MCVWNTLKNYKLLLHSRATSTKLSVTRHYITDWMNGPGSQSVRSLNINNSFFFLSSSAEKQKVKASIRLLKSTTAAKKWKLFINSKNNFELAKLFLALSFARSRRVSQVVSHDHVKQSSRHGVEQTSFNTAFKLEWCSSIVIRSKFPIRLHRKFDVVASINPSVCWHQASSNESQKSVVWISPIAICFREPWYMQPTTAAAITTTNSLHSTLIWTRARCRLLF